MKKLRRPEIFAIASMILGPVLVFGFIFIINFKEFVAPKIEKKNQVSFRTKKVVRTPKRRKKKKIKKLKIQQDLIPNSFNQIAGLDIDFGLNKFNFGEAVENLFDKKKNIPMTQDSVDQLPVAIYREPIEFPEFARRKKLTGYVTLNLLINAKGKIEDIKLVDSKPQGVFETFAIDRISKWEFQPAIYQGQPVPIWVKQNITFNLN